MLTKKDINYLEERFVLKTEFHDFKHEMITRLDALMFELKAMREEMAAANYRQAIHSDTLENHEERLVLLEKPLATR